MGTGDKDEGLRDDGNLEVDDHVTSVIVDVLAERLHPEFVLKEARGVHDGEEGESGSGEVETVAYTIREYFGEVPRVRGGGR